MRFNRHEFWFVLLLFAVNKILVLAPAVWATLHRMQELSFLGYLKFIIIDNFYKWDSGWYAKIAESGYDPKSAAFFPLYPILLNFGKKLLFLPVPVTGILISNLAFLGLLYFAYKLVRLDYDEKNSRRIMWMLCLYPTSYYFSAVYTESLFLLLVVATLFFIRSGMWEGAAASGFLSAITRNTGVFLTIPCTLESLKIRTWGDLFAFLRSGKNIWSRVRSKQFLMICLMPLSFFAFLGYLAFRFQDPFAFSHAQPQFGRDFLNPFVTIYKGYLTNLDYLLKNRFDWYWIYYFVELFAVSLSLFVLIGTIRKLRLSYWVIILYSILIPLSAPAHGQVVDYFVSYSRYSLVVFPLYIGLYELIRGKQWLYFPINILFAVLLVTLCYHWSINKWVA